MAFNFNPLVLLAVAIPNLELFISLFGALCLSALGLAFPAVSSNSNLKKVFLIGIRAKIRVQKSLKMASLKEICKKYVPINPKIILPGFYPELAPNVRSFDFWYSFIFVCSFDWLFLVARHATLNVAWMRVELTSFRTFIEHVERTNEQNNINKYLIV